jgi:hypothetical protein
METMEKTPPGDHEIEASLCDKLYIRTGVVVGSRELVLRRHNRHSGQPFYGSFVSRPTPRTLLCGACRTHHPVVDVSRKDLLDFSKGDSDAACRDSINISAHALYGALRSKSARRRAS